MEIREYPAITSAADLDLLLVQRASDNSYVKLQKKDLVTNANFVDRLAGKIPTLTGSWGVAPTNLANATDGSSSSQTTEGRPPASSTTGYFNFDMGAIYFGLLRLLGTFRTDRSTFNQINLVVQSSIDNVVWIGSTYSQFRDFAIRDLCHSEPVYGRYIRIGAADVGAGTALIAIKEINMFQIL